MGNKQKLQTNNTELSSILSTVKGLPTYVKPSGLHVWKRSNYIPAETVTNPSFTFNVTAYSTTVTISNENFDLTKIVDWKKFFDGFGSMKYDGSFLTYSSKIIVAFDPINKTFTIESDWRSNDASVLSYSGTKVLKEAQYTFVDYVVSDSESAYPDGGVKDGYWYEKFKGFMFGLTKEAHGSFTPSANIESTYTLEHNLGERPKFIVVYTNDSLKGNQYAVRAMSIVDRESYDSTTTDNSLYVDFIYNGTSYSSFEVYRSSSTQVKKANFDQYKVPIKFDSISYLKGRATYYWQVMA